MVVPTVLAISARRNCARCSVSESGLMPISIAVISVSPNPSFDALTGCTRLLVKGDANLRRHSTLFSRPVVRRDRYCGPMGDPMIVGARSETASWRASARRPTNRSRRRNRNGCALQGSACSLQRRGPASARAHKCNENRDRSTRNTRSVGQNISLDQSVKGKVTALRNNEFGSTDQRNPLGLQGQQDRAPRLHLLFPPRKRGARTNACHRRGCGAEIACRRLAWVVHFASSIRRIKYLDC